MASNSTVRGINKRDSRSKTGTGAGGRRKALLPDKVFLSDPEATALIRNKLTPVYFGGWAAKQGTDYFTFWYVCVDGKWTASSGADVPHLSCVYRKDIGTNRPSACTSDTIRTIGRQVDERKKCQPC